jgi:hypothetical protein
LGSTDTSTGIVDPSSAQTDAPLELESSGWLNVSSKIWRRTDRVAPAVGQLATSRGGAASDGAQPAVTTTRSAANDQIARTS